MAASWDAPAKRIVEKATADAPPRPRATGVAPATSPKGTAATSIGAMAAMPARASFHIGAILVAAAPLGCHFTERRRVHDHQVVEPERLLAQLPDPVIVIDDRARLLWGNA